MDIRRFVESLRGDGELLEVTAEIDARLELAAITDLMCKHEGPGLLFTQVRGTDTSLASNLFGSDRRTAHALGEDCLESFGRRLTTSLAGAKGDSSALRLRQLLGAVEAEFQPSERIAQEVNLDILPEIRYWPAEERSFLTLAVVVSRAPESSIQNYGLYRVAIAGDRRLTLNLLPGSGAGEHLQRWRARGKSMPVAVLLGADPALIFAAAAPLPGDCSEESFSAYLNRSKFKSCHCQTIPLSCPTSAQLVIEGWIDTESALNEGPFGCYTGDYGGSNDCPLIEVSGLSMVADPLIPVTLAGPLPMEDCWIAKANLEIIGARLTVDIPEISSIEMPLETAFHGVYFVTCMDSQISLDALSQRLRNLDYLARIKLLVLLRGADESVTDTNWRGILKKIPAEQIWQAAGAGLEGILNRNPAKLRHDPLMLQDLLLRLRIDTTEFTGEKG